MIDSLTLKFSSTSDAIPEPIPNTPVTVFVGPNNSGKSRVLSEIDRTCVSGPQATNLILQDIVFRSFSIEEAEAIIEKIRVHPVTNENLSADQVIVGRFRNRVYAFRQQLVTALVNPSLVPSMYALNYLSLFTLMLDGTNRITLVDMQSAGDFQHSATNTLQALFQDDTKREEVRRIVYEAFVRYFVIDPTFPGNLRVRLSDVAPATPQQERGWDKEAVEFHAKAQLIAQASDGVKAFTGIIAEIVAGEPSILLIDEPEAFLYPPLAFKLGQEVARSAKASEKRIFCSTHSASFVRGCIQSGAPVTIIRLTYRGNVATARVLRSEQITELMRDPLLRSTGVLDGLFYEFVVITESDSDRAFYQEINDRLLQFKSDWGIPNCLFINAQNKQTIQRIIKPLRELGIPAVGIVDIDVLKNEGADWSKLLQGAFVPNINYGPWSALRSALKQKIEATGKNMKREGGVEILEPSDKEAANDLLDRLAAYGIFAVRKGELESWLKHLDVGNHGSYWLISMFEKMGEDPNDSNYVKPSDGDVWEFMSEIKQWFVNPERKGIPS